MGKNLIQQRRGKGSIRFRVSSKRYVARAQYKPLQASTELVNGTIKDIVHCRGHSSPLIRVMYDDAQKTVMIAAEGINVGDMVADGSLAEVKSGNTLPLKSIPEGTAIFNIESQPGDGGKFVRSSGVSARILTKTPTAIMVELPSKKQKSFHPECRACVGIVAGSGRKEKPFYKAGRKHFEMKATNRFWPKVSGAKMNAVDHPFGGSRSSRKGRPTIAPKNAPPGRKVGMIRPRRTGRTKR